ncbi:MAG: heparan-alpha-glucosaminide N-acetyltransferase domain-containing protein [Vicinamibacterales bacterium]|nr:heparan-alpha-glucosaminide N-acetyltransferase domain-containing protein [Vicinamibacterales bacterium]
MTGRRLSFVDHLRGVGVLIMIEAHVFDSWMRLPDRSLPLFYYARVLAGWAAPTFLFLAGLSLAMGMGRRLARGEESGAVARAGWRRGAWIFALAILFRLQSALTGATLRAVLKVDILNVMGLAMLAAVACWNLGRQRSHRVAVLLAAAAVVSMVTPLLRLADWPGALPYFLDAYIRPIPGRTSFALFPWAGFVFAGAAAGLFIDPGTGGNGLRRLMTWFGGVGAFAAVLGFGLSFLPSPYADSQFWTSSPAFFLLRCGVLLAALAVAYVLAPGLDGHAAPIGRVLTRLGTSSLFVYWVHVELVYGFISRPLQKHFSFGETIAVYGLFVALVYGLVVWRDKVLVRWSGGRGLGAAPESMGAGRSVSA